MATCLGAASPAHRCPASPLRALGDTHSGKQWRRLSAPQSLETRTPAEMGSIIAKTDLPRPPAQAGVLAAHNTIDGQLPVATVCGERGSQGLAGAWTPCPGGLRGHAPPWGEW